MKSKLLTLPAVGRASSLWGHTRACCSGTTQASLGSQWGLSGDKVPLAQLSVPAHGHPPRAFKIIQFGKTDYSGFPHPLCDSKAFVCLHHAQAWPRLRAGVLEAETGASPVGVTVPGSTDGMEPDKRSASTTCFSQTRSPGQEGETCQQHGVPGPLEALHSFT